MRRTTITALLATTCLTLAGCSNSGGSKPAPTVTVTATKAPPTVDAAAARKACVDAWAVVLHEDADADPDADMPGACGGVAAGDRLGAYMDGLQQRNRENIDAAKECLDDPSCTSLPIP